MPDIQPLLPTGTTGANGNIPVATVNTDTLANTTDYDAFLKLLVTQLKNQDPTEPSDPGEFIAQLATFSGVEQQIQINNNLSKVMQATLIGEAGNLIGLRATSADGSTSGIVTSVAIGEEYLTAKLQDGSKLPITTGVSVE